VVIDKRLSGEEIRRAKVAKAMHRASHIPYKMLVAGCNNGCYFNVGLVGQDFKNAVILFGKCNACVEGNMKAPQVKTSESAPANKIGSAIAMDLHPMANTSLGGSKWILYAVDEKTGYILMYGLKDKSTDSVNNGIRNIVAEISSYGHRVERILFDNEAGFNACALYVRERKILPLYTPSGLHNRLIERYTQTINNKVRILEVDLPFMMPSYLGAETIFAAKDSINKTICYKSGKSRTPYELMTGIKPVLSETKFGSTGLAYVNRPDTGDRSEWGVYLSEKKTGSYRVYIPSRRQIYSVRKFVASDSYPLSWGWKRRTTLLDNGRIKEIEDEIASSVMNRADMNAERINRIKIEVDNMDKKEMNSRPYGERMEYDVSKNVGHNIYKEDNQILDVMKEPKELLFEDENIDLNLENEVRLTDAQELVEDIGIKDVYIEEVKPLRRSQRIKEHRTYSIRHFFDLIKPRN